MNKLDKNPVEIVLNKYKNLDKRLKSIEETNKRILDILVESLRKQLDNPDIAAKDEPELSFEEVFKRCNIDIDLFFKEWNRQWKQQHKKLAIKN